MKTAKFLAAAVAGFGLTSMASAAAITFTSGTVAADSDVLTNGTLVGAYNFGASGTAQTSSNGVTFQADPNVTLAAALPIGAGSSDPSSTSITLTSPYQFTDNNQNYAQNTSDGYFTMMNSSRWQNGTGSVTNTFANLQTGKTYEFQLWSIDKRGCCGGRTTTVSDGSGDSVLLHDDTGPNYAIGVFTADSSTQTFTTVGTGGAHAVQGIQLRVLPEPGSLTVIGVGAAASLLARRRRASTLS